MILITHILLATTSIIYASLTLISPSKTKLNITYLLTLGTIISGALMTIVSPQLLGRVCMTGVIYLIFIIAVSLLSQKRLSSYTQL